MLSRHSLLKHTVRPALNYFKVDKAAYIHLTCCDRKKISLTTLRSLNDLRGNILSTGLFVRHNSSTSSSKGSIDSSAVLDPIPEPPTPLPELAQSTVENLGFSGLHLNQNQSSNVSQLGAPDTYSEGPDIYRMAIEVFTNLSQAEDQLGADTLSHSIRYQAHTTDPSATTYEIYKAAAEIWGGFETPLSETDIPSKLGGESAEISQLPSGLDTGTTGPLNAEPTFSKESEYTSIFDNIPDPPVVVSELVKPIEALSGGAEPAFSSLGLGGWTPVGMIQSSLEFLHIDCALPWWGAVVCVTVVIRAVMFPLVVLSQRNVARLQNNMPQVQAIQLRVTEARQRGDKIDAARYSAELMEFMKKKNVNPLKNMLVPICQTPVFLSMFWGLRSMAQLPVESLKTGGILWFVDLTVPDQFYLLPLLTCSTLFMTIRLGVEGSAPTTNSVLAKYFISGIPVLVFPFIMNFPGLMLTYWTTSNFISLFQVGLLRIPALRDYCKIERLIIHEKQTLPLENKGFVQGLRDAWTNMKITSELDHRERADKMNFLKAGREPIKKTYKYDPTQKKVPMQRLYKSDPSLTSKVLNAVQAKKRT